MTLDGKPTVLVVDDEEFNRDILHEYLTEAGYAVLSAQDAMGALRLVEAHPELSLVVLDRMMPGMDGIEVLKRLKADPRTVELPVVLQTAATFNDLVVEGIQAGAFYYLTKPYQKSLLLAVVTAAIADHEGRLAMREALARQGQVTRLMDRARFRFRTTDEARDVANFLAAASTTPEPLAFGLNEILLNAVEHGNLGVTYAEKTELVIDGTWTSEIQRRLALDENIRKRVVVEMEATAEDLIFTVRDEGKGFDWSGYLELAPERATDPHGRGIALSGLTSFTSIVYRGCGNEVVCTAPRLAR